LNSVCHALSAALKEKVAAARGMLDGKTAAVELQFKDILLF
jgi:hypothetical protein